MFDGVSLNYKSITVIVDATAAATDDVHAGMCFSVLNFCAEFPKALNPTTLFHKYHYYRLVV